jgi:release factor glutamine methyltransferase
MNYTLGLALEFGRECLAGSDGADIDARMLLCHVMQCSPTRLHSNPEMPMSPKQWQQYQQLIEARAAGRPVAHLTGVRGFWTLDLAVDDSTLIPRADTELLVSLALGKLQAGMQVADLGTGSGAIALALASERPDISVLATDFSFKALQLARRNAERHDIYNVRFLQMSWLRGFHERCFDFIVSNPPYIELSDAHLQRGDVRFEPRSALVSGEDGLDDIRQIVEQAGQHLKKGGWLLVEHGYDQSARVQSLFTAFGFEQVLAHQDFGGHDRAVMGQLAL